MLPRPLDDRPRPSVSVVLATLAGWPEVEPVVRTLAGQADEVGGEVVVADGSAATLPPGAVPPPRVSWMSLPGAGIFDLRRAALQRARGDVVVVTEDHCLAPPGWCARIVDLHARYPDADIIQGRVENASRERVIDWAAFLVNQSAHVPPIDWSEATRQIGIVGVSITRPTVEALLAAYPADPPDLIPTPALRAAGLRVRIDESLGVEHRQSDTWLGHAGLHFHNARAIAGRRRSAMTGRDWVRLVAAPMLVPYRASRVVARCLRKDLPRGVALRAAPGVVWLYAWKSAGEWTGYLTGPGDSARRLR